jgi:hypothetical protein
MGHARTSAQDLRQDFARLRDGPFIDGFYRQVATQRRFRLRRNRSTMRSGRIFGHSRFKL